MNDTVTVKLPNSKEDAMICRPHKLRLYSQKHIKGFSGETLQCKEKVLAHFELEGRNISPKSRAMFPAVSSSSSFNNSL